MGVKLSKNKHKSKNEKSNPEPEKFTYYNNENNQNLDDLNLTELAISDLARSDSNSGSNIIRSDNGSNIIRSDNGSNIIRSDNGSNIVRSDNGSHSGSNIVRSDSNSGGGSNIKSDGGSNIVRSNSGSNIKSDGGSNIIKNSNNPSGDLSNRSHPLRSTKSVEFNSRRSSDADHQRSVEIDKQLAKDKKDYISIIIIGNSKSGKTTLFKQIELIYLALEDKLCTIERRNSSKGSSRVDEEIYLNYKSIILNNIFKGLQVITGDISLSEEQEKLFRQVFDDNSNLNNNINNSNINIEAIKKLWSISKVKSNFEKLKKEFPNLIDECQNFDFFLDNIDRIMNINYIPTYEDILKISSPTKNIVDLQFEYQHQNFKISDTVGNFNNKYLQQFNDISKIIYTLSLVDITYFKIDNWKNMLQQFSETINCDSLRNSSIILFLTKDDMCYTKYNEDESFRTNIEIHFFNNTKTTYEIFISFCIAELNKMNKNRNRQINFCRINLNLTSEVKIKLDNIFSEF